MAIDLTKLNKEQREAVTYEQGPLLIVAGAGTGKTTVITQRLAYLIETGKAKPEEILAVTFTDKAAEEMEERVDRLLPYGYVDLWVSTFHAFCERILRDHALDIGLPTDFKILDGTAGWLLVYKNFNKFNLNYYRPLGNPTKFIQAMLNHFSHCKDQAIYPEDYLAYAEKIKTRDDAPENQETERIKEVASAYHVYQKLLLESSVLDFGDLINYCLKLFQQRTKILKKYREKFKYVLVDEFQDTNWAQYELIKILSAPKNNLTVSADDDQAIYKFRGASFSNIIQFKKDFPKAKEVSLVKNYRSTQNILDLAYKFIKANNPDRLEFVNKINKKLVACKEGEGVIEHLHADTLSEEVSKTIKKIQQILKKDKETYFNDIVILSRTNDAVIPFIKALEKAGLPYQFLASRGLYAKPAVLDVISYFKLLDNYHESQALYRILNLPFLGVAAEDVAKLTQYSYRKGKSLYEAMGDSPLIYGISEKSRKTLPWILSLIKKHTAMSREKTVSETMIAFLKDSGYLKYLIDKEGQEEFGVLDQFLKKIKNFEVGYLDPSLNNFMREITLEIESGEQGKLEFDIEQGPDMIKVMTIHGAKGLEFKHVFLVNMVDKRFPTIERGDPIELPEDMIKDIKPKGDVHLQEERRICYVAMTRAKKELYFTSAEDYGLARRKKLSRFMVEMGYKDKPAVSGGRTSKYPEYGEEVRPPNIPVKNSYQLPDHFSYSQLAAFQKCPLQYKFAFILRIPVRGKAVFSFGKTMHAVFHEFLKIVNAGQDLSQTNLFGFGGAEAPIKQKDKDFKLLEEIYEKNWIDEWYENKSQKEEYYKLGKKIIKDFYEDFVKNPPKILKIGNALALETPFNLKMGGYTLNGRIDRIDQSPEGVVIIDYKTGKARENLEADDKEQLLIYQIAVEEVLKLKPKTLTYYYLNEYKKASFLGSDKDKENLKERVVQEIEKIKKSDFKPTPGWQCSYCDFKDICDFAER